ncbi:glycosyltransferase [Flavobacteriaceae bacterium R38]|nr:glycosyltransferase [Flavobacteriaceae bacterium R38]
MKKVLIITYYWPPAGGPGVQRWLKFVKYLKDFKVDPVVYIPESPDYPLIDESFLKEIPGDITILKKSFFEPYKIASVFSKKQSKRLSSGIIYEKKQSFTEKVLLWIRGNLFIPDARKYWVKPSVKYLSAYLEKENIDTVITTGPPHSVHLIGMKLKERTGVRWISDFRDPWTTIGYHKKLKLNTSSKKKHQNLEKKVLNTSDLIIVTSKTTKSEFEAKTPQPIHVITNGFDVVKTIEVPLDEKFTISHIGSLLSGRNPKILWESLSELITEHKDFSKDFQLQLAGTVSKDVLDDVYAYNLKDHTRLLGYLSHHKALELQRSSQLLSLIEIDSEDTKCIIPGKLFEYLVAKRPILAIGPENWDVFDVLRATNGGTGFSYSEKNALKEKLISFYNQYKSKKLTSEAVNLEKYSRKSLTGELASLIHKE